eukprot:gene3460-6095_t
MAETSTTAARPAEAPLEIYHIASPLCDQDRATCTSILQSIQRDINCLSNENRAIRKRALLSIKSSTVDSKNKLNAAVMQAILHEILKPLLKKYEDPTEKCRELAIEIISSFLQEKPETSIYLPYIIPAYAHRLGQLEIKEPSEELRKILMDQLEQIINLAGNELSVYIEELTQVLTQAIVDPFPEVKRMGCRCTALLANAIPQQFHMVSERYTKPLLITLCHQHAKVRNVCIRAIGAVVLNGSSKMLEEFYTFMAQRTMDHNPTVRKSVYVIAARWLLNYKERYSYWHKIIPILLIGETDEVSELSNFVHEEFIKVGKQYEKENEQQLKDHIEFGSYRGSVPYGCIDLVQQNFSKIFPGLLKDLRDWGPDTRRQ